MADNTLISNLLRQLKAYRDTLQPLIEQQIRMGILTPPYVITDITKVRQEIARLKDALYDHGMPVEDQPNDIDPEDATIQEQIANTRKMRLRACFHNLPSFINDRLGSFVGRRAELADIRAQIAAHVPTGGYVTITGQAGQGKSSVIAALLSQYSQAGSLAEFLAIEANDLPIKQVTADSIATIAHHFIPFNPGLDHQVSLLRNLIARLVLVDNLPEIYLASYSRPALKDAFKNVLDDIAALKRQALIFIDGLDQIEEDQTGTRDLSFLPTNPPAGIVFVLGTRPNDTLKPLELLKPRNEYIILRRVKCKF